MKKGTLFLVLILALGTSVFGQENSSSQRKWDMPFSNQRPKNNHKKGQRLVKMLELSSDQQKQMKQIREEEKKKMQQLEQQQDITVKAYNDKKTVIRKERKAKRDAVLTPEQKQKIASLKDIQKKKKELMMATRQFRMKAQLNLTEGQSNQLNQLQEKNRAAMDKIKNDSNLNDQQKKLQMQQLKESAKASRDKIFTPEQLEKIKSMKTKQGGRRKPSEGIGMKK
jgi:Spy/CpxP family protein refolding chaperone